jgi:hypothetical protein
MSFVRCAACLLVRKECQRRGGTPRVSNKQETAALCTVWHGSANAFGRILHASSCQTAMETGGLQSSWP